MRRWRWPVHIDMRGRRSGAVVAGVSGCAVMAAFVAVGLVIWGYGVSLLRFYAVIIYGSLGDYRGLAEIGRKAAPLLFAGIGLVVAFRARIWNIGAEGQLLAGAVAAAGIALFVPLPAPCLLPVMFVAGGLAGALWGLLPTVSKIMLDVNEVLTTLMMNYIAIYLVQWLIHGPWKGRSMFGFAYTDTFPQAAWLPLLPGTRLPWPSMIAALALAGVVALLFTRTRLGYEMQVLGQSPEAARYAGIPLGKTMLLVMLISGGAAGLAGVGEVAGTHHKLLEPTQMSLGYGYTAIIVAWLARGNALAAILSAVFVGFLFASGDVVKVTLRIPVQVVGVMNGLILLFLIGSERLIHTWTPSAASASGRPHE